MMRKSVVGGIVFLLVGLLFSLSVEALSVYIPQPQEDEIRISKNEYVLLHLVSVGYQNDSKALVRFLKGHEATGSLRIEIREEFKTSKAVPIEFGFVEPILSEAYFWQGDRRFKANRSSSGYFWINERTYRAQCLLNELGYSVGKPDGKSSEIYKEAVAKFSKNHGLDSTDFTKIFEKLEYEAERAAKNLPTLFIQIAPRQSGPWVYPEVEPIVKKEYLAGLYLAGLGYQVELQKIVSPQGKQEIQVFLLEERLKEFQKDYPLMSQTNGKLTDQVLADLRMIFYKKYTEPI